MKKIMLCVLLCCLVWGGKAQQMAALFTSMPDALVPQLEEAWRKDLVDLYQAGKEARLKNTMNGYSALKKLTADYLSLQVSDISAVELKLFPLVNDTQIIGMITTVNGPVPDSRIAFYTTDWKPLEAADLFAPVPAGWFIRDDADRNSEAFRHALSLLDMELVRYTFSPDALTLTAAYTTPDYLSREDREQVLPFLKKEPKVYTWEKYRFK